MRKYKRNLKRMIMSCLVLLLGSASAGYAEPNMDSNHITFSDVSPSFWGYQTIQWGVQEKIITGYPDHTVRPTGYVKESEFITLLVKNYSNTSQTLSQGGTHWAEPFYQKAGEFNWLDKKGIVDQPLTRGQAAQFIAASQGYHHNVDNSVQFVLNHRLASGKMDATVEGFDKNAFVTRVEAVQLLKNLKDKGWTTAKPRPGSLSLALVKQKPSLFPIEHTDKNGNFFLGLMDRNGKIIVEPKFKTLMVPFGNQPILVGVKENEFWYINKDGKMAFSGKFKNANPFSEGLAAVQLPNAKDPNRDGYINEYGKEVIPPNFVGAQSFSQGYAQVGIIEKGKPTVTQGIIDHSGKVISSIDYDLSHQLVSFNEGVLLMNRYKEGSGNEFYFADRKGNQISPNTYGQVQHFSEGLAAAQVGQEKWGYVDSRGNLIIPAKFKVALDFSEGLAAASVQAEKGHWKYGYIDYDGNWVIEPIYDHAGPFSEGWAPVELNGKWGFINKENKWQLTHTPYQIVSGSPFINGLSRTTISDGKTTTQAYIDKKGNIIWKNNPDFK